MKILFLFRHAGCLRVFDSTVRALHAKGHQVIISYNLPGERVGHELSDQLKEICPGVEIEMAPFDKSSARSRQMNVYASVIDRLRYFNPAYDSAPKLTERAQGRVDKLGLRVGQRVKSLVRTLGFERATQVVTRLMEALPPSAQAVNYLKGRAPDLVVISPLVDFGSEQVEYLHAALSIGIPVAVCVHSWDNLTNKGLLRLVPDEVVLWNPAQAEEAVAMHGVPRERISVTGAQVYDSWFEMTPSLDYEGLARLTGLDPSRPYVLYTGSSSFIGGEDEPDLVQDLRAALDASSDERLRKLQILVRPHPQNPEPFEDLDDLPGISVWPKGGELPVHSDAKTNYFDSIYHSKAVVGVNTSAMIEASIIDRPVMTVLDARFEEVQQGTLHFKHLLDGGFMFAAQSCGGLAEALRGVLDGEGGFSERNAAFIARFVRPHSRDVNATDRMVEALEQAAVRGARSPLGAGLLVDARAVEANVFLDKYFALVMGGKRKRNKGEKKSKLPKAARAAESEPEVVMAGGQSVQIEGEKAGFLHRLTGHLLTDPKRIKADSLRLHTTQSMLRFARRGKSLIKELREFTKFLDARDRGEVGKRDHYRPKGAKLEFADKENKFIGPINFDTRTGADGQQYKTLGRKHLFDFLYLLEGALEADHVILGPWTSEVGYELLYWVPLINYLCKEGYLDPSRTCLITRGGAHAFYGQKFAHTFDIFDEVSLDELAEIKADAYQRGESQKQFEETAFDNRLIARAIERFGFNPDATKVVHPRLMYNYLSAYWAGGKGTVPISNVLEASLAEPYDLGDDPELNARLPKDYVCLKFYFRDSFPANPENTQFVSRMVASIAERRDVVCLNTAMSFDDHVETSVSTRERVHFVNDAMTPSNNLLVQGRVIARSQGFVGTYGGLSYLPMFVGRDSFAFSSGGHKLNLSHDLLAFTYARQFGVSFHHFRTAEQDVLRLVF